MATACGGGERDGSARAAAELGRRQRSVYRTERVPPWGCASTRGHREAMEDACAVVPLFADVPVRMLDLDAVGVDASAAMHLFGVFDGHGGSQVANYCRDRIQVVLREAMSKAAVGARVLLPGELWEKAFCECFQRVDDEVSGEASRSMFANGVSEARREPVAHGQVGSTAVVALVCSPHIIVANCGDSRAVLRRGKDHVPLSADHKPDRNDERARIEAAGGRVINWHGAHRVEGVLAMSRSIGDRCIKPFIIPKPEVRVVPRQEDDDCLIIASDGLWDVISNEAACRAARLKIHQWHRKNGDTYFGEDDRPTVTDPASQAAANYLVRLALSKGSQDNITVIVINLKRRKMVKDNNTTEDGH